MSDFKAELLEVIKKECLRILEEARGNDEEFVKQVLFMQGNVVGALVTTYFAMSLNYCRDDHAFSKFIETMLKEAIKTGSKKLGLPEGEKPI